MTAKDLLYGHKKKKKGQPRTPHPLLPNIAERPEEAKRRSDFGHWEMDLVVGCKGSRAVLLTLTERKTRFELIFKLKSKKAAEVRAVFDRLERKLKRFKEVFKTITTDNGSEFLEYDELIRSIHGGKRFEVYYCNSFAAWQKGTNENHNRIIRRFFPKGTSFDRVTKKQIAAIQSWMNDYPRKLLNWSSPNELLGGLRGQALGGGRLTFSAFA